MADFGDINLVKREISFGGNSKLQWAPTAARTALLPDKTGTIAFLSDIPSGGASSGSLRPRAEALAITTANTVPSLSIAPAANTPVLLIVEEVVEDSLGANPAFTVTGQAIAWSAANAGYNLPIGASVTAYYWEDTGSGGTITFQSATKPTTRPDSSPLVEGDVWIDTSYSYFYTPFQWRWNVSVLGGKWSSSPQFFPFDAQSLAAGSAIYASLPATSNFEVYLMTLELVFRSSALHDASNRFVFSVLEAGAANTSVYSFASTSLNPIPPAGLYSLGVDDTAGNQVVDVAIDPAASSSKAIQVQIERVGAISITDISGLLTYCWVASSSYL